MENVDYPSMDELLDMFDRAKNESEMLAVRLAANKYKMFSGDSVGTAKIYSLIARKSLRMVNPKPVNQRLTALSVF